MQKSKKIIPQITKLHESINKYTQIVKSINESLVVGSGGWCDCRRWIPGFGGVLATGAHGCQPTAIDIDRATEASGSRTPHGRYHLARTGPGQCGS
jgi:hypothetical protein